MRGVCSLESEDRIGLLHARLFSYPTSDRYRRKGMGVTVLVPA